MLLLGVRGELTRVHSAFADPRVRWRLCASAALVSVNWLIYVWAIGNHPVVESMGGLSAYAVDMGSCARYNDDING